MTGSAKQSRVREVRLDCFVALAPYNDGVGSTLFWRNIPNTRRKRSDIVASVRQIHPLVRRRPLRNRKSRPPLLGRPDRPRHKTAAAVWADVMKLVLGAVRTERALVRADARFHRIRRQVLVAIFAVRTELQRHDGLVISGQTRIIAKQTPEANDESPSISDMAATAPTLSAAASSSPSTGRARSRSGHAPRSGAASAHY
jgi:hypothetical protein